MRKSRRYWVEIHWKTTNDEEADSNNEQKTVYMFGQSSIQDIYKIMTRILWNLYKQRRVRLMTTQAGER
jgi:hypothetical protein